AVAALGFRQQEDGMIWTPRSSRRGRSAVGCALAVLLASMPAAAQNTGTISGSVVDHTAQLVPGATVTLTNEGTTDVRTAVSDDRGQFAFRAVEPGAYTVKVELTGFRTFERRH